MKEMHLKTVIFQTNYFIKIENSKISLFITGYDVFRKKDYYLIIRIKLATLVEGDLKAPFSIATTLRSRGGRYSFPWIAPLYP